MIIPLEEAQKTDPEITPEDLLAFEQLIREETNNTFQDRRFRYDVAFLDPNTIDTKHKGGFIGIRPGDRIEITGSDYNDGLYTVSTANGQTIEVEGDLPFITTAARSTGTVTKVVYPPDIKRGIRKLIQYDQRTADHIGLKSRTVARMSETFVDPTSGNHANGYPDALLDFLKPYRRMRWE